MIQKEAGRELSIQNKVNSCRTTLSNTCYFKLKYFENVFAFLLFSVTNNTHLQGRQYPFFYIFTCTDRKKTQTHPG